MQPLHKNIEKDKTPLTLVDLDESTFVSTFFCREKRKKCEILVSQQNLRCEPVRKHRDERPHLFWRIFLNSKVCFIILFFVAWVGGKNGNPATAMASSLSQKGVGYSPKSASFYGQWSPSFAAKSSEKSSEDGSYPLPKSEPPVEWGFLLVQGFSGAVTAATGGLIIQSVFESILLTSSTGEKPTAEEIQQRRNAYLFSSTLNLISLPWGVAGAVYGVGLLSTDYVPKFWWILLGAYTGKALSFGVNVLLSYAIDKPSTGTVVLNLLVDGLFTGLGAMLFHYWFRTPFQGVEVGGPLFKYRDGRWSWGIPLPSVEWEPSGNRRVTIPLLSGKF